MPSAALRAALLLMAATACMDFDAEPIEIDLCGAFPGPCVSASNPIEFVDDFTHIALGGQTPLDLLVLDGLVFRLTSSDPSVLAVSDDGSGGFAVAGLGAGIATLTASRPNGVVLKQKTLVVEPVARVGFRFAAANASGGLASLAAVPGAAERLIAVPTDATDQPLAGAERLVTFVFAGSVEAAALASTPARPLPINFFGGSSRIGFEFAARFTAVGAGTITAETAGVPVGSLPVDVIAAPDGVSLDVGYPDAVRGSLQVVTLRGTTAAGVPVAGLTGDFTASPASRVRLLTPRGGGSWMELVETGPVTVTATLPATTVSASFEIR